MKVLGIAGSPREGRTTHQLVEAVLDGVECETNFISLAGKRIRACIACLGCVADNVCVLEDDMKDMRPSIVEADAYVVGAANYFGTLNGLAHCFLERWYQFRHHGNSPLAGRPAVAVSVGGGEPEAPVEDLHRFFEYNQIECIGSVSAQGPASCFDCGFGEQCKVGAIHMFFGPGTKITPEITPSLEKQPEALEKARELGRKLSDRLKGFAAGT
jgi:multimeric flavodoxin WrbA